MVHDTSADSGLARAYAANATRAGELSKNLIVMAAALGELAPEDPYSADYLAPQGSTVFTDSLRFNGDWVAEARDHVVGGLAFA